MSTLTDQLDEGERVVTVDEIPNHCASVDAKWALITDFGKVFVLRYEGGACFRVERATVI